MLSTIQNSFAAGEFSPSLFGRTDLKKYHSAASTYRNMFANYRGGGASRAGYAYVGTCLQTAKNRTNLTDYPPRDIPFQFNILQGYALEFGDQYMRIKTDGAYVVELPNAITAITKANPGVFTYTNTNYTLSNGDWIYVAGVGGMTEFNGLIWIVAGVSGATFHVLDLFGNAVDTTLFTTYTSGGFLERIYTVAAPYAAVDLPYLKFTQSADTMSLTCVNQATGTEYPPYDLVRNAITSWAFTQTTFTSSILPPTGVTAVAQSSTTLSTWYSYVVTAVSAATGEESIASAAAAVENNDISVFAGSNTITWNAVAGASNYNIYSAIPSYNYPVAAASQYGFCGTAFGTSFSDTNIQSNFTSVPPTHQNPFARGQITRVVPTAGGSNISQAGISYTVTTSTGSGFSGIPIVVGGSFVAMYINNNGGGYLNGDTISFQTKANGTYTFTINPTNLQTIVLNGTTWTFTTAAPVGNQSQIGTTVQATLDNLVTLLNASADVNIVTATYNRTNLTLNILYKTTGTGGNAYTLAVGTYNGAISGATLAGGSASGNATATLTVGAQSGTYPGVVAYYQQRRGYANSQNNPDTYFFSRPGAFKNMDTSIPSVDSDAIVGAPWAQQINGIQFMQPMPSGLVMLTGNGAWLLNGGSVASLTPSSQTVTAEAYNGCNNYVPPLVINYDILYVQSKGSIVRDLSYNFFVNIYTGDDKTIFANHLFNYRQIRQWAWAEEPYKVVWAIRDDGVMLSLTYLKEQDVYAWAHHDTDGAFVGVCSITEPPVNAVYAITKRYIQNQWMYYSERADNRNWVRAEDCFCVDAGLLYPQTFPSATLTPAAATGTNNITSINLIAGGSGYTTPVITVSDPTGQGSGATFSATLAGGIITAINILTGGQDYQPGSTLVITDSTGSGALAQPIVTNIVSFVASSSVFTANDVGSVIRIGNNNFDAGDIGVSVDGGGKAIVTSYISGTHIMANIIEEITSVIPNDPEDTPVPAIANQWSITKPVTTVSGLNHLEGKEVAILADGSVIPNQTVVGGMITLPQAYSAIVVGLPFTCQLQTMYMDPESQGTVQGKRKNIGSAVVRTESSRGFSVGTNQIDSSIQPSQAPVTWHNMVEVKERNALIHAGSSIPLFTGDSYVNVESSWNTNGQVAIQQTYPLPLNVLAVVVQYVVGDTPS